MHRVGHQPTELASYGEIVVVVVVIIVVVAVGKPSTDENGDSFLSGKASTHALRIAVGKAYAVGKASTELGKPQLQLGKPQLSWENRCLTPWGTPLPFTLLVCVPNRPTMECSILDLSLDVWHGCLLAQDRPLLECQLRRILTSMQDVPAGPHRCTPPL